MSKVNFKDIEKEIRKELVYRKEKNSEVYSDYRNNYNIKKIYYKSSEYDIYKEKSYQVFRRHKHDYTFHKFNDISFGDSMILGEEDYAVISGVCFNFSTFKNCHFTNVLFDNCTFAGCLFRDCICSGYGVVFNNCTFGIYSPLGNKVKDVEYIASDFEDCKCNFKFVNSDLSNSIINNCSFTLGDFTDTNLYDVIFLDCSFHTIRISDCDMKGTKIINPVIEEELYLHDIRKTTKFNEGTILGRLYINRDKKSTIKKASEIYKTFAEQFKNNNLMEMYGEYFYLSKKARMHYLQGVPKVKTFIAYITCGYGERPVYCLYTSLFIIFICTIFYMKFGVKINGKDVTFYLSDNHSAYTILKEVLQYFHFSLVTFTTVGYGNVTPIGLSLIVSGIEVIIGAVMIGIATSTLVRKMTR